MLASEIIRKIKRIEIRTRRIVDHLTGGAYRSVFKGQGMEFDEVREYMEGDEIRTIDWNVTARTGHPYIKKFIEEREMTVFLVVDFSASGQYGSGLQTKQEMIAELSALLAFSAIRNNDQVALLLFTDQDELYIPAKKGKAHVLRLIREILAHDVKGKKTNIQRALEQVNRLQKRKAVVFIISDLLDQNYEQALKITNRRHDVIGIQVQDHCERQWPSQATVSIEDAESGEIVQFATQRKGILAKFKEANLKRDQATKQLFKECQVDLIEVTNGEDFVKPLMNFFRKREKKR
jgi:uncharacterized protein (DUF58 family)